MATPTYPGVYVQELQSAVHSITGVATSVAAFVGSTARGIDDRGQMITSFADYERLYGGLASDSEVSYAVQQFFNNGGTLAWVVRAKRKGAGAAGVVIGTSTTQVLTFAALSSGAWANGELLIDVDYNGLYTAVAGSVAVAASATVTGTGTFFKSALEAGEYLIFAADTTLTPYQIKSVDSDTQLTLQTAYTGATSTATTAVVTDDPLAFNLTITNLADGTVEPFPDVTLNSSYSNYVQTVINDYDNGSQLVKVTQVINSPATAPPVSGVVGAPATVFSIGNALLGAQTTLAGTVSLTNGNSAVTGTGTAFDASMIGQWLTFSGDSAHWYRITGVTDATDLAIAPNYNGTTGAGLHATLHGSAALAGTVDVSQSSPGVTGHSTNFTSGLVGQWVVFASDATQTPYLVSGVTDTTHLTLATPFLGATHAGTQAIAASANTSSNWGLSLSVTSPSAAPPPLPITIPFVASGSPLPMTMAGLAAQLQRSMNAALSVQMRGASVQCSVFGAGGNQSIRINASLPQMPDAVISFPALASATLTDASTALGLNSLTQNVAHYALGTGNGNTNLVNAWGGLQNASSAGSDGTGLPSSAELIGDQGLFTGMYALLKVDSFNILCIPEATRAAAVNSPLLDTTVNPNAIYSAAIALCDKARAFLLIDPPPYVNTIASAVDWKTNGLTVNDPNGAAYFPRVRVPDPLNNFQLRTFAPCGVVAGLYANTDATRGVWKAPAGTTATLVGVQSLTYKMSDVENGELNPLGLNCFRTFPIYGTASWGARTLVGADAETSQWKYVPVRRTALFLESSLYQGLKWVVFEPNDEPLWSSIRLNVGAFMQNLFVQGFFQGSTPAQAYLVKCDSETTTQADINNGIVNIVVGFAPLKPAEFVIIKIEQLAGQTAS